MNKYRKSVIVLEDYEDFEELVIELSASNLFYSVANHELKQMYYQCSKECTALSNELNQKDAYLTISSSQLDLLQDK